MSKGSVIPYEFVVRLILTIILIAFVITCTVQAGNKLFRKTEAARDSFEKFSEKIETAKSWEEDDFRAYRLDMDENSFIVFFSLASSRVQMSSSRGSVFFERPPGCSGDEACACLCQEYTPEYSDNYNTVSCSGEPQCEKFGEVVFKRPKIPNAQVMDFQGTYEWQFTGGAVIQRNFISLVSDDFLEEILEQPRNQVIYIEKGEGNEIGICREGGKCFES